MSAQRRRNVHGRATADAITKRSQSSARLERTRLKKNVFLDAVSAFKPKNKTKEKQTLKNGHPAISGRDVK